MEQAAEAASSSSRAPELTSVTAPPPSPRKQKQLAAAATVRLAKKNAREFAKAVNDFARELEVAKRVWQFKGRKVDSTMKKDPIGSLCRQMKSNKELEMAIIPSRSECLSQTMRLELESHLPMSL